MALSAESGRLARRGAPPYPAATAEPASPVDAPIEDAAGPGAAAPAIPAPWRRVAALLVDSVTVLFVNLALVLIGTAPLVDAAVDRWSPEPWGRSFVPTVIYAVLFLVYQTAFVAVRGQTPGMDLLDLKVLDAGDPQGRQHPGWRRALVRAVPLVALRFVPGALLGTLALLAVEVTAPLDHRRRGLQDLVAGTVAVGYDADVEEADEAPDPIDRDELAETYGPRRLVDFLRRWFR
jgi:uncharacterized RDD family membrane protein YckC